MSYSEAEARIRRLLSRIADTERRMDSVQDKILRTRQDLAGFYQIGAGSCVTTLTGKVIGGDAAATGLVGSTIQVIGHVTSTDYGTFTQTGSTYTINLSLDSTDTSVDLIVVGPGSRFTAGSAVNKPVTQCTSNSVANIQATPATGYHYLTGADACQYPIKNTLSFDEPVLYGTHTITWSGGIWSGSWCQNQTSSPGTGCASSVTCGTVVFFDDTVTPAMNYPKVFGGVCPVASLCPSPAGPQIGSMFYGATLTKSITCPDNSTLFSVTFSGTIPAGHIWYPAGPWSITYYET